MSATDEQRYQGHLRSGCTRMWFHDGPCAPDELWAKNEVEASAKPPQRAFRGKSLKEATDILAQEFAGNFHTFMAAKEHLIDYKQHCIRWGLEEMARMFEEKAKRPPLGAYAGAYITIKDLIASIREAAAKYDRGEL